MTLKVSRTQVPQVATTIVFVAICAAASLRYPNFLDPSVFLNLLRDYPFLGLTAIGMTFVILTGGIDLSVGAVVGFTSILMGTLITTWHWHPMAAVGLSLGIGSLLGCGMGFLVSTFSLPPFLVTLGGMFLARGSGLILSQESIPIEHPMVLSLASSPFAMAGVFLAVLAVGLVVAHLTPFGRNVYAIGGNEHSAMLMGLPVHRTKVLVYTLSGFCSALGGVVYAICTSSGEANAGLGLEMDAIAAVVIGGTLLTGGVGNLMGTFVGVLILGVLQTVLTFEGTLSSWWTRIVIGVLVLLFILLQRVLAAKGSATRRA